MVRTSSLGLSSCKRQQVESRVETCISATKAPSVTVAGAMRPTVLIASGPEREIRVAADEAILGSVRNSVVDDVTAAVAAATGALDAWRRSGAARAVDPPDGAVILRANGDFPAGTNRVKKRPTAISRMEETCKDE